MRPAYFVLVLITLLGWWMLFDLWPGLPDRIPLLPWGATLGERNVERSIFSWFVVPIVGMTALLASGICLPEVLMNRAAVGRSLPFPAHWHLDSLPLAARVRILRPVCWSLVGAAFAHIAFFMTWWARAAAAASSGATAGFASWSLPASGMVLLSVGWRWSTLNAAQESALVDSGHEHASGSP